MPSAHTYFDDLVQILSFFNRPQLFKFLLVNRLFVYLLGKHFPTKPYANAILRIWTEEADDGQQEEDMPKCRTFVGIAILDNFFGNQEMHQKITNATKLTRKWQWYADEENERIHLNDIVGLQKCGQIVQFFQNVNRRHGTNGNGEIDEEVAAYWTYCEKEACFVHQYERSEGEEDMAESVKELQMNMLRTQTQMRYMKQREHLIANNFNPTCQCPLSAKFEISTDGNGIFPSAQLQHFLNSHLNSQKYTIHLLSVEFSSPQLSAYGLHKNTNKIIIPQISFLNETENVPTTISKQNNTIFIMSPKSFIVKYEDGSDLKELIDFIYHQSTLQCTVQIQLPSTFLEKRSIVRLSQEILHDFLQHLLQDFLLPNGRHSPPAAPRTPFICTFFIHPDHLGDILHSMATLNLRLFTSQHKFRRLNFDEEDVVNFLSVEDISPALQRLIVDEEMHSDCESLDTDSLLGFAFYDSNAKDYWRLHWTQLSADLCEVKICQFNEERDQQFFLELNNELGPAIDRIKKWLLLKGVLSGHGHRSSDAQYDKIGPFLGSQNELNEIKDPLKVKEEISHYVTARQNPLRLARIKTNENRFNGNFMSRGRTRSEPDLRRINRGTDGESRCFVAIQDNQPGIGDPAEELAFRAYQLMKVYGKQVDGYGYFWAEISGRYGLVPAAKLVQDFWSAEFWSARSTSSSGRLPTRLIRSRSYNDLHMDLSGGKLRRQRATTAHIDHGGLEEHDGEGPTMLVAAGGCRNGRGGVGGEGGSGYRDALRQLMMAKEDYNCRQQSPNVDAEQVELSFRQGDFIIVYGPMDGDGFYLGEMLNGIRGLVPSNFIQTAAMPFRMP